MPDVRAPVLVIYRAGRGGHGALAIARTLGRLGVPVYLAAQDVRTPVAASRFWVDTFCWDASLDESRSVDFLSSVGQILHEAHRRSPLLLTAVDWPAILIERNADVLSQTFRFPRQTGNLVERLANKWELFAIATEHGIPTPTTFRVRTMEDAERVLAQAGFPLVAKPADSYRKHVPTKAILGSRKEFVAKVACAPRGADVNLIVQEHIPGDPSAVWMCNGYFSDSTALTLTGRKLRQVDSTGVASLAVCMPNETVAAQTHDLMRGVGYRGCVGVGYKFDPRDGRYKLLDVNPRVSAIFRLFVGPNDMDVVRLCYLDMTDQAAPGIDASPGRTVMLEEDLLSALSAMRQGTLTFGTWVKSLRSVSELQWFAKDDLWPFAVWLWTGGLRRMSWRRTVQAPRAFSADGILMRTKIAGLAKKEPTPELAARRDSEGDESDP